VIDKMLIKFEPLFPI